ncbi:hypothetical protein [Methylobacterium trifolii]|uniref:FkbM family methyltransferase n=1 Tax=Methylobacterium trifolii TaxID=1003092 RepID=A0ABQ4U882_9HYPH|nr:hypothetical protein [Methylobacterium trifolii]GJE62603.1 hypothetical protein MPOCJGCO_4736 [Methylobacterium trifolii]
MNPATWRRIETIPSWRRAHRLFRRLPEPVRAPLRIAASPVWSGVVRLVLGRSGGRVVSGPFTGNTLDLSPVSQRHLLSYLLGTTELEIRPVVEKIVKRGYRTILNIGAADGYYAVGFASRSPGTRIVAFEAKEELHPALARIGQLNGVADRITIRGLCDETVLRGALQDSSDTLVLMDIEGAEKALLDPAKVSELARVDVLVETHDVFAPGCTEALIARFSPTHDIERHRQRPRVLADFPTSFLPSLPRLAPRIAVALLDERRFGTQEWLHMTLRRPTAAASARSATT